jgi:hypothetical protein
MKLILGLTIGLFLGLQTFAKDSLRAEDLLGATTQFKMGSKKNTFRFDVDQTDGVLPSDDSQAKIRIAYFQTLSSSDGRACMIQFVDKLRPSDNDYAAKEADFRSRLVNKTNYLMSNTRKWTVYQQKHGFQAGVITVQAASDVQGKTDRVRITCTYMDGTSGHPLAGRPMELDRMLEMLGQNGIKFEKVGTRLN